MLPLLRNCFRCILPTRMKPAFTSTGQCNETAISAVADDSPERPLLEPAAVVSSCQVTIENERVGESTWNLDMLFSGSYLFQETSQTIKTTQKVRQKREKPVKPAKPRPTHFLAVKIDSPEIVRNINQAQTDMVERLPELKGAVIPTSKLHVTLTVLHLPKREDVEAMKMCLSTCSWPLSDASLPSLQLHGVGHFRDSVVYAGLPSDHEATTALKNVTSSAVEHIRRKFPRALLEEEFEKDNEDDGGMPKKTAKGREFQPHVTLAKLSKSGFNRKNSKKKIRKIDRTAHDHLSDNYFGEQRWDRVQLLAMQWPSSKKTSKNSGEANDNLDTGENNENVSSQKKSDGYYFIESEVLLQTPDHNDQ